MTARERRRAARHLHGTARHPQDPRGLAGILSAAFLLCLAIATPLGRAILSFTFIIGALLGLLLDLFLFIKYIKAAKVWKINA